ncbi:MAG TPA: hypothetical protein EYG86_04515 [Crocinitomicaceae bacterium]|nr:hypothetical protein [Crocinitomicaceae bacterium]
MKTIILFIVLLFTLSSCIKNNPEPSWIQIDEWQLLENPNNQVGLTGVLTENISDAWVYVNGETIGVFELPVKLPLLVSGDAKIQIFPAVKNNGISATKKIYPFLEPYVINTNLVQSEVFDIAPTTMYFTGVKFNFENFQGPNNVVVDGPSSLASSGKTNDPAILDPVVNEGEFLKIQLNTTNNIWIASTTFNLGNLNMPLPKGKEVYLELDYYNTNRVTSGLIGISVNGSTDNPNVQLNPQKDSEVRWKKIYIDLREVVSGMVDADYFEFTFQGQLDDGASSGVICLDNIKAVYF